MVLTRWESARNESNFLYLSSFVVCLIIDILYFCYCPFFLRVIASLAIFYFCKVSFFPPLQEDGVGKTFIRAFINLLYLGSIYAISTVLGTWFSKKVTLYDAYEMEQGRKLSAPNNNAAILYIGLYFFQWVSMLTIICGIRLMENIFTGVSLAIVGLYA